MIQTKEEAIQAVKDAVNALNIATTGTDRHNISVRFEQGWNPMIDIKATIGKSAPIKAFITETTSY